MPSPDPSLVTQLWASLLPRRLLPYSPGAHTAAAGLSCRLTLHRHWLRVDYLTPNLPTVARAGELLPESLAFLAYYDEIDLRVAMVTLLPDTEADTMDMRWPVGVEQDGQVFVLFTRADREKADLLRALHDASTFEEDELEKVVREATTCACEGRVWRETQGRQRARFAAFMEPCLEGGLDTTAPLHLLRMLMHKFFFDLRDSEFLRSLIIKKILKKLSRVGVIRKLCPDLTVEGVEVGEVVPSVVGVVGHTATRLGLGLAMEVEYSGLAAATLLLWPGKQVRLRVEVRRVEGEVVVTLPPNTSVLPMDRVWLGFSRPPHLELELELVLGEGAGCWAAWVTAWLVSPLVGRLLQVALCRIKEKVNKAAVSPNSLSFPFKFQ